MAKLIRPTYTNDIEEYRKDVVEGGDGCVVLLNFGGNHRIGNMYNGATIEEILTHPESECSWIVVDYKGVLYEVDIPYSLNNGI